MKRLFFMSAVLVLVGIGGAYSAVKFKPGANVTLRIVDPAEPRLLITNTTQAKAEGIRYWIKLWNLDNLAGSGALVKTHDTLDRLAQRATAAPVRLFAEPEVRAQLRPGNRVVGAVGVTCRTCAQGHSYRVDLTYGESGWFAEVPGASGRSPASPKGSGGETLRSFALKETLLAWLKDAKHGARIEIAPLAP